MSRLKLLLVAKLKRSIHYKFMVQVGSQKDSKNLQSRPSRAVHNKEFLSQKTVSHLLGREELICNSCSYE
jgi:hypothetical protein